MLQMSRVCIISGAVTTIAYLAFIQNENGTKHILAYYTMRDQWLCDIEMELVASIISTKNQIWHLSQGL